MALRLYVAQALDGKAFNDTAIVGLMAMHELAGRFYAFYWGQSYMGSTESLSIAPFFALFGANEFTLSIGLLPWFVAFTIAVYGLTRLCGGECAARIAALLSAVSPAFLQYHEMMPIGGYPETLALGTALLALVLRLVYRPLDARAQRSHLLLIGGIAGLAFWTNWLILPYFIVAGLYLLLWDRRLLARPAAWLALAAFFLGSLPFWVYNLRHGFATFHLLSRGAGLDADSSREADLLWVLGYGIPNVLGVRELTGEASEGAIGILLAILALCALGAALLALRRSWLDLLRGRIAHARPVASLFVFAAATAFAFTECRPTTLRLERYLTPFATATIPLSSIALSWLIERKRAIGLSVLGLTIALYSREIVDLHHHFVSLPARFFAGPVEGLSRYLVKSPIRFAYADYGDAMITTFLSGDRVVVTDFQNRRYPIDEETVVDPAIILHDQPGALAETTLASLDAAFSIHRIPGYRIFWPIRYDGEPREPLARDRWKISASTDADDADLLVDGDPTTSWSPSPDAPAPTLTLDLGAAHPVNGVYFDLGDRAKDGFHRLTVETSTDGSRWELAKDARWDFPVTFRADGAVSILPDNVQMVLFPSRLARWLRLALLETFPHGRWTVGELHVFGAPAAPAKAVFQAPVSTDPGSFAVAERRLRRETERFPDRSAPWLELRDLYRTNRDDGHQREIDRLLAARFRPQNPLDWTFGGTLSLIGYDRRDVGNREIEITYYWKARRRLKQRYAAFVRLNGPGSPIAEDCMLGDPIHPTETWEAGEIVKQTEHLRIPPGAPTGHYRVVLGVWSPVNRETLRVGPWWHPTKSEPLFDFDVS